MLSEAAASKEAAARREKTDRQLLERFVGQGDQAAFAELVARHGPCVWTVCRRVLGHQQDAEDAFQAVFLILGRKAGVIRKREAVGSWLHGVAFRTAMKVRRAAGRRQARDQHAGSPLPEPAPPDQAAARELQRILDEEVARLTEKYRSAFVLCCLEGLTRDETAQELGLNKGTVSSRLAQARAILQKRLAQRGFTLSAVLTACALAEGTAATAAPPALFQAAVQAGIAGNAAAAFSPGALTLAQNILHALLVTKVKTALSASLLLALVTAAAGVAASHLWSTAEEDAAAGAVTFVPNDVWSAEISKDGKLAAAGAGWWDKPGEVAVWDLASRKRLFHTVEKRGVGSVAWSPDGKLLASASWTGDVRLREVPSGKEVADFKIPGISFVAFSPDGSLLAAASEAKMACLIDVAQRRIICALEGDLVRFHCVAFSPDGKRLLAGGGDWQPGGRCQVTIWDVASKKQVSKLVGHAFAVMCLAFSPDGKMIATGGHDKTIRLWNAETATELKVLRGHERWVESLTFSKDGKSLVSGALDGTLRFWDVERGRQTAVLGPRTFAASGTKEDRLAAGNIVGLPWAFSNSVRAVRFTPDGATLLVGGGPRTLRLFDLASRKEIAVLWESPPPPAESLATHGNPVHEVGADGPEAKPKNGVFTTVQAKAGQAGPASRELPEHLAIDFSKGLDAFPDLRLFGPDAAFLAKADAQGLRLTLAGGRDDPDDVGIEARRALSGDFEITLAYVLVAVPVPGPDWGAGAVLEARFAAPDSKGRITRTQKPTGAFFGSTYYTFSHDGRQIGHPLKYPMANEKVRTGRLRLARTGKDLAFQVAEGGAAFRTLAVQEVGTADVVSVRAFATSGKKPLPVEVRFSHLDLRGSKIAAAPPADPAPSRIWLWAAASVVLVMSLSIAGVLLIARSRRINDQKQPAEASRKKNTPSRP
jgi:RNA polymerase sigma factor (sigma-70 family)